MFDTDDLDQYREHILKLYKGIGCAFVAIVGIGILLFICFLAFLGAR